MLAVLCHQTHAQQLLNYLQIEDFALKAERSFEEENYDSARYYSDLAFSASRNKRAESKLRSGLLYAKSLQELRTYLEALEVTNSLIPLAETLAKDSIAAVLYTMASKLYAVQFVETEALAMAEKAFEKYLLVDSSLAYKQLLRVGYFKSNPRVNQVQEGFNDIVTAYHYFITDDHGDVQDKASAWVLHGFGLLKIKQYDQAIKELKHVLAIDHPIELNTIHNAHYYLSWVYYELKDYNEALKHGLKAYEVAVEMDDPSKMSFALSQLNQMSKNLGDYRMALHYHEKADSIMGILIHQDYSKEISRLKIKYESEQKQREIDALRYEKVLAQQETIIFSISIVVIVLVSAFGFTLLYRRYKAHMVEMKLEKQKKAKMQKELEHQKSKVATHSLDLVQKEKLITDIKKNIQGVKDRNNLTKEASEELGRLVKKLDFNSNMVGSWEDFRIHFEQAQGDLSAKLAKRYPSLSNNELRLCSLAKSGLSVKEMAVVLNISTQGVKTARYRLRKKLGLKKDEKLVNFLHGLESQLIEN